MVNKRTRDAASQFATRFVSVFLGILLNSQWGAGDSFKSASGEITRLRLHAGVSDTQTVTDVTAKLNCCDFMDELGLAM